MGDGGYQSGEIGGEGVATGAGAKGVADSGEEVGGGAGTAERECEADEAGDVGRDVWGWERRRGRTSLRTIIGVATPWAIGYNKDASTMKHQMIFVMGMVLLAYALSFAGVWVVGLVLVPLLRKRPVVAAANATELALARGGATALANWERVKRENWERYREVPLVREQFPAWCEDPAQGFLQRPAQAAVAQSATGASASEDVAGG